jgi:hypothetical protein
MPMAATRSASPSTELQMAGTSACWLLAVGSLEASLGCSGPASARFRCGRELGRGAYERLPPRLKSASRRFAMAFGHL